MPIRIRTRNPPWSRDELILALALYVQEGRHQLDATNSVVLELSSLLRRLPIHPAEAQGAAFRNANAVAMKLGNFTSLDPEYPGRGLASSGALDRIVWNEFAHDPLRLKGLARAIRDAADAEDAVDAVSIGGTEEEFAEGKLLTRMHLVRERNRAAVTAKKSSVLAATGRLECECCGFDFQRVYGELGKGFAECHHTMPLAALPGSRRTHIRDLTIVCANCHRMLHFHGGTLSVTQLVNQIASALVVAG